MIIRIACYLGRVQLTTQRELARNSTINGAYKPNTASVFSAQARQSRGSRCQRCSELHEIVTSSPTMGWTPQQTSGWLHHERGDPVINHESIYRYVYLSHRQRLRRSRYLPRHHAKRGAIENTNNSLRIDLPRKTKLKNTTDKNAQDLALMYNNAPRKFLGHQTPDQIMLNEISAAL